MTPTATSLIPVAAYTGQAITELPGPVKRFLDNVGQWLSELPVNPLTDMLSESLWLARRTLFPVGAGAWSSSPCSCAADKQAAPAGRVLTVTNPVDGEAGSLRDVLGSAESGDVIRFAPGLRHATLHLTRGELNVDTSVRIEGTQQTLAADGLSRIMRLDEAGTSITLVGLTFADGAAPGDPGQATTGGAILADGVTLRICGTRFVGNRAASTDPGLPESAFMQLALGGAIAAIQSGVSISDSAFIGNRAAGADNNAEQQASGGYGGAIYAQDTTIALVRTQFTGNAASGGSGNTPIATFPSVDGGPGTGGAIFSFGGGLSADHVTFQGNSAIGGNGLDGTVSNPYGNTVGDGGNAAGGAVWAVGRGQKAGAAVLLELRNVMFKSNSAVGGVAGTQGLASLQAGQGGLSSGGALGTAQWVAVTMADVTFESNHARAGGGGPNAAGAGENVGYGGKAQGGGAYLESTASVDAWRLLVRNNTAQGGAGGDSSPGNQSGVGGWAFGGGLSLNNTTTGKSPTVIPLNIRDSRIVGNSVLGGRAGEGAPPPDGLGAGGAAQGGGMVTTSLYKSQLVGVGFIDNSAVAGQGKFAIGGGLNNAYGSPPPGLDAGLLIQNSSFRNNTVVGGDDAPSATYRASGGGAFFNNASGTVVSGSRFNGNSAVGGNDTGSGHVGSGLGGAILSEGRSPTIDLYNSAFEHNSAVGGRRLVPGESFVEPVSGEAAGGAIRSGTGAVTVSGGSFVANQSIVRAGGDRIASGGAIDIAQPGEGFTGYLNTVGVRFNSNVADSDSGTATGGAIAFNGTAFADNGSTFRGNVARSGQPSGSAYGGALYLQTQSQLNGSKITRNYAHAPLGYGGGAALPNGPEVLTQVQSSLVNNRASTAGDDLWSPSTEDHAPII